MLKEPPYDLIDRRRMPKRPEWTQFTYLIHLSAVLSNRLEILVVFRWLCAQADHIHTFGPERQEALQAFLPATRDRTLAALEAVLQMLDSVQWPEAARPYAVVRFLMARTHLEHLQLRLAALTLSRMLDFVENRTGPPIRPHDETHNIRSVELCLLTYGVTAVLREIARQANKLACERTSMPSGIDLWDEIVSQVSYSRHPQGYWARVQHPSTIRERPFCECYGFGPQMQPVAKCFWCTREYIGKDITNLEIYQDLGPLIYSREIARAGARGRYDLFLDLMVSDAMPGVGEYGRYSDFGGVLQAVLAEEANIAQNGNQQTSSTEG